MRNVKLWFSDASTSNCLITRGTFIFWPHIHIISSWSKDNRNGNIPHCRMRRHSWQSVSYCPSAAWRSSDWSNHLVQRTSQQSSQVPEHVLQTQLGWWSYRTSGWWHWAWQIVECMTSGTRSGLTQSTSEIWHYKHNSRIQIMTQKSSE